MAANLVKCPHCFGEKPAEAKVCLHCARDEQGFGPLVPTSQALMAPEKALTRPRRTYGDLKLHMLAAILVTTLGLLMMLSSGLGSLLFIIGVVLLATTKLRMWWSQLQ